MPFSRPIRSVTNWPGTTMEQWSGIGLKPGFVLSWAGKNQVPILKPAPLPTRMWTANLGDNSPIESIMYKMRRGLISQQLEYMLCLRCQRCGFQVTAAIITHAVTTTHKDQDANFCTRAAAKVSKGRNDFGYELLKTTVIVRDRQDCIWYLDMTRVLCLKFSNKGGQLKLKWSPL